MERMADILCMSRSSLLRKIKILFNLSPIDFIRLIRLKKAAELIQEGKYRIGDICYMVGINSSSYFSKLFLKQFGMTPKEFEKQYQTSKEKAKIDLTENLWLKEMQQKMTHLRILRTQMSHCCKNPIYCCVCILTGCQDMPTFDHAWKEKNSEQ